MAENDKPEEGTVNKYFYGVDAEAVEIINRYAKQTGLSKGRALSEIVEIFDQGEKALVKGESARALEAASAEFEENWGKRIKRITYVDINLQTALYELNAIMEKLRIQELPNGHSAVWDQAMQTVVDDIHRNKELKDNRR